jgi:EF-P beta-lysylation protein EpmB
MILPWRQIQRQNFTRVPHLADYLELGDALRADLLTRPRFPLNVPQRLAAKMKKNTLEDPILRQFVPTKEELLSKQGFVLDPVQDKRFHKTKKILHKYNGRALILSTGACAMNCRFCFRQNFPYVTDDPDFSDEIAYLSQDATLSEAILSGGDPLSLSDNALQALLSQIDAIPHVKRIRFHTRFPIGIPERIDPSFLAVLRDVSKQIIFIIHCNHPRELDSDVAAALKRIQKLGLPVLNQSTLLKGVNDDPATLLELCQVLTNNGVIPYYLNELDPVEGAAHFDLPSTRGPELIQYLRENLSGYGVPRLVREVAGRPSKSPITD